MSAKTPISMLQELMVAKKKQLPEYYFTDVTKTLTEPKFACTVVANEVKVVGEARTKKEAKQLAAEKALIEMGYSSLIEPQRIIESSIPQTEEVVRKIEVKYPNNFNGSVNYIGKLNEYASRSGLAYPSYQEDLFPAYEGLYKVVCNFKGMTAEGSGPNKKIAKQISSCNMLSKLKDNYQMESTPKPKQTCMKPYANVYFTGNDEKDNLVIHKFNELSFEENPIKENPQSITIPSNTNIKMTSENIALISKIEIFRKPIREPTKISEIFSADNEVGPFLRRKLHENRAFREGNTQKSIEITEEEKEDNSDELNDDEAEENETLWSKTNGITAIAFNKKSESVSSKKTDENLCPDAYCWEIEDEYTIFGKFVTEKLREMDPLDAKNLKGNILSIINESTDQKVDAFRPYNIYEDATYEIY